jgi:hypothetical protein
MYWKVIYSKNIKTIEFEFKGFDTTSPMKVQIDTVGRFS